VSGRSTADLVRALVPDGTAWRGLPEPLPRGARLDPSGGPWRWHDQDRAGCGPGPHLA